MISRGPNRSSHRASTRKTDHHSQGVLISVAISFVLAALVWIVFGPTLHDEFLNYDDNDYVYDNLHITGGLTAANVRGAFTHFHADNWHPLTSISHMLDCQLYGLQPLGHHPFFRSLPELQQESGRFPGVV